MRIKEQINTYPSIGQVSYKRNLRAKRLSIRIKRSGEVKITIPGILPFKTAEDFVLSKKVWIIEKVQEIKSQKQEFIIDGFKTSTHILKFIPSNTSNIRISYNKPIIAVNYPVSLEINNANVQNAAKKAIELAYRIEAQEYLPGRLKVLASENGFKFSKVTIRKSVTRWGSCSSKNNISLSLHLMKLPATLIDYILLHELCHTVHKNHGPKFWELLNLKSDGNAKFLAKEVKKYSTKI